MADKVVSPGVFSNEIDASFLPATIGDIGACIVGPTVKGPVLQPTVVTSYAEFQSKFGSTFKSGSSYYQYLTSHAVENYLRNASTCTIVRVAGGGASVAEATISSSVDPNWLGPGAGATDAQTGSRAMQASASITLNTITANGDNDWFAVSRLGSNTLSMFRPTGSAQGNAHLVALQGSSSAHAIANGPAAMISASSVKNYWYTTGSTAGHGAIGSDAANFINASQSLHNIPMEATGTAKILKMSASYYGPVWEPLDGISKIHGSDLSGSYQLYTGSAGVVNNGADAGTFKVPSFTGGADFNNIISGSASGSQGGGIYKKVFKLHTLAEGAIMNNSASSTGMFDGQEKNGVLWDGSPSNVRYEINNVDKDLGSFNLLIRAGNDSQKRKQVLESWTNVNLDPNSRRYIGKVIGDQYFTVNQSDPSDPFLQAQGDYPNMSKYVRVEVLEQTADYFDENGNVRVPEASCSLPGMYTGSKASSGSLYGSFSGGSDGTQVAHPHNFYNNITTGNNQGLDMTDSATIQNYEVALQLLANQDEYDFNLLIIPGIIDSYTNHTGIVTKALDVVENRGDAFLVYDVVPFGTSNVSTVTTQGKTRDSSYAATYWPWVQVRDRQIGSLRWVPPSVVMSGIYSFNDKVGHPWFAPAGLNRGLISTALQAERKLTHSNRDELYLSSVNPLATFTTPAIPQGQGVCVWGQKTLQKKASALDRVNVRRLMIKVKKFIAASSRFLIFEQNTVQTRNRFLNIAQPFLEQVQAQSGVSAFKVIMDDTNNTPDLVDRNILYGQIFIQPTRTAEFIILDFTVQPTGATFPGE